MLSKSPIQKTFNFFSASIVLHTMISFSMMYVINFTMRTTQMVICYELLISQRLFNVYLL